ncbi:hypothetical protein FKM82_004335, partial [Ascaphus truei]
NKRDECVFSNCFRFHFAESAIHSDPLFSREKIYFMSRKERYERAVRITFYLKEKMKAMGWTSEGPESKFIYRTLGGEVALNIHNVFVKCVSTLGSDKQISTWLPLATNYNILGTYAQTELGHGTYLRGLETTATFDISTQEFVINTPKLTATKWWPGDCKLIIYNLFSLIDVEICSVLVTLGLHYRT